MLNMYFSVSHYLVACAVDNNEGKACASNACYLHIEFISNILTKKCANDSDNDTKLELVANVFIVEIID